MNTIPYRYKPFSPEEIDEIEELYLRALDIMEKTRHSAYIHKAEVINFKTKFCFSYNL